MDDLRTLYESLGFEAVTTYINSGNVLFKTGARDLVRLARRIEGGIATTFGFHSDVILRTPAELREVLAANPFAARPGLDGSRLAIHFLPAAPAADACDQARAIRAEPEELHINGRELYIYFPNGMARPTLSMALLEKTLKTTGTSRNLNTVRKLLDLAEKMT